MSMLTIVPSRGRPHAIDALLVQCDVTRTAFSYVMIVVDDDDPQLLEYQQVFAKWSHKTWVLWSQFPRLRMAGSLNKAAMSAVESRAYDVIGFMGDDHRPRTYGWDQKIDEFAKNNIVYGNDLFQRSNLPTAVWMPARFVEAVGGMVPPNFIHLYLDNIWKMWGEELGRLVYLDDVVIEHMHPAAGKGELDASYGESGSGEVWTQDGNRFNEYRAGELYIDVAKMRSVL